MCVMLFVGKNDVNFGAANGLNSFDFLFFVFQKCLQLSTNQFAYKSSTEKTQISRS